MNKQKQPNSNAIKNALEEYEDDYLDLYSDDYPIYRRLEIEDINSIPYMPIVGEIWQAHDTSYDYDGVENGTEIVIVSIEYKNITYSILNKNNTPLLDTITEALESFLDHYAYLADNCDEKNIMDIIK